MKKSILFILLAFIAFSQLSFGQIYNPVKWDYKSVKTGDRTYDVIFQATIESGWFIYSQYLDGEDGPIPTSFNFDDGDHFSVKGKNEECDYNRKEVFDKLFDMNLVKYQKRAIFRQAIEVSDPTKPLMGYLEFMTCDDEKCLPPAQVDFEIDLSKSFDSKAIDYSNSSLCKGKVTFAAAQPAAPETRSSDPVLDKKASRTEKAKVRKLAKAAKKEANEKKTNEAKKEATQVQVAQKLQNNIQINLPDDGNKIEEPVIWKSSITRLENGNAIIEFTAEIEKGWHIYSNTMENDDGPIRTTINFDESDSYDLIGGVKETAGKILSGHDKFFDMSVVKLKENARLAQSLDVKNDASPIKGFLEFMACTDSKCLTPMQIDFEADPKKANIKFGAELDEPIVGDGNTDELEQLFGLSYASLQDPIGACVEKVEESNSIWGIFILGFLGGLIALLTPCVFPMIPLTVSFFTKSSEKKGGGLFNAIFYGFSILLVYVLISVPFHLLDTVNPNILNDISTNMWLNIAFFVIFLFFAFSFFGYFDLTLPASVTNKISAAEGVGGVVGVFFYGLDARPGFLFMYRTHLRFAVGRFAVK